MNKAVFETSMGEFEIELFTEEMPITTENFIKLAKEGFYDGTKFHRVIAGFMIQGGDPLSKEESKKSMWGTGDPGYKIKDEFGEVGNVKGTIAMANAGPNTGGSQFFINVVNNNFLDDKHPVFGKVVSGMNIVENIAKVAKDSQDKPLEDVIVEKVTIK
ncbi:MAG: peptidylprolyl isomerase [Nanoarchaeota archaeon]|nr:peptidylprolyl isomerase [Nanoarchaeota archaeon]